MKLKFPVLSSLFFFLFSIPGFSAPVTAPVIPAVDASRVGVIAAVRGTVKMDRKGQAGVIVKSGQPVYLNDEISTDDKGNLQVLLLDETIFTIGPNSTIVIDQFIYDPSTQNGQINAKVVKGAFRFVTGKIARKKPADMKVELPAGSIGVRGTIVAGHADGMKSTVVLLGPGSKNNSNSRIGQITLSNEVGGENKQVTVTRPGYGSVIDGPGSGPSPAFEIPAAELDSLMGSLGPTSSSEDQEGEEGGTGGGGDPTQSAGQDTAAGGDSADTVGGTGSDNRITAQVSGGTVEYTLNEQPFGDSGDPAVFFFDESPSGGNCSMCGNADITVALINSGGEPASYAAHNIEFDNNGVNTTGSGISDKRDTA